MVASRGSFPDDDDEIIPLTTVPTYKTVDDNEYEGLPSYSEAIRDEVSQEPQETTEAPLEISEIHRPSQARRTGYYTSLWPASRASSTRDKDLLFQRQYVTFTILGFALFPGLGILGAAIYLYQFLLP